MILVFILILINKLLLLDNLFKDLFILKLINKSKSIHSLLNFQCHQNVNISQTSDRQTNTYNINGIPYQHNFYIQSFNKNQTFQGNFVFPFKLLLSSELPGSLFYNAQNFIRYVISAQLQVLDLQQSIIKSNEFIIHITQPFRAPLQSIDESATNYPQCCGCCQSYGTVYVKVSSDKNLIKSGESVTINAEIDNTHGKVSVRNGQLRLIKHIFKGSPDGKKQYLSQNEMVLQSFSNSIQNGAKNHISITKTIPRSYSQQSSSFGTVIAIYYTLNIKSQMGICSQGANIQIPIFFQTIDPYIQQKKKIKVSAIFSSYKTYPIFTYTNMKGYIYKPVNGIPYLNRKNFNPQQNLFSMNKMYAESTVKQDTIYEIKKTTISKNQSLLKNQNNLNNQQKEPVDPDGRFDKIEDNKLKINRIQNQNQKFKKESKNQQKYMQQEDQNDYGQFKDFQQNHRSSNQKVVLYNKQ